MYDRICGCGATFSTNNFNRKKCRKNCRRATTNKARHRKLFAGLDFVGVDGEGVGRPLIEVNGEMTSAHDYVMLSVGNTTLTNPDGSELTYREIFPFLYSQYKANPHAAWVGFYLKYDFIQWTKSLPEAKAFQLWDSRGQASRKPSSRKNPDPFPVYHDGWEFDLLASRRFRLRPHICRKKRFKDECNGCNRTLTAEDAEPSIREDNRSETGLSVGDEELDWSDFDKPYIERNKSNSWMYICDTGGYWQSSFMTAINPNSWPTPICTPEEYATLKEGKANRDTIAEYGDTSYFPDMIRYNTLENDVLARITSQLNNGFTSIGLNMAGREWYGPGRVAQTWLNTVSKSHGDGQGFDRVNVAEKVPAYALEAGRKSYYGGWFEQFAHGHIPGDVWEYDINSAYPYIISNLPCLLHGSWTTGADSNFVSDSPYVLLHATVSGSDPYIGSTPYRSPKGRILRPQHVTGWYWKHELDASRRAGLIDTMDVHEWVSYNPCECVPPLAGIANLYQARLRVDKASPQGRGYKLVYNSAYGKMAQSIGEPKFANSIYASLITAGCRTLILEAIASHPGRSSAVTMVATDGVYFTSPHPNLELSETELGKWGSTVKRNMTQFMPGVYWDDETRNRIRDGGLPKLKSRGINAVDLAKSIESLDVRFRDSANALRDNGMYVWPEFDITTSFEIVSCNQALQRHDWETAGRVTKGKIRHINSNPQNKRNSQSVTIDGMGMVRTLPYPSCNPTESTDYSRRFGMELAENILNQESVGIDGDNNDMLAWILNGELQET